MAMRGERQSANVRHLRLMERRRFVFNDLEESPERQPVLTALLSLQHDSLQNLLSNSIAFASKSIHPNTETLAQLKRLLHAVVSPNKHSQRPQSPMEDPPIRIVTSLPLDNPLQDAFYAVVSRANDPFNSTCYLSAIFSSRLEAVNHLRQLICTTSPVGYLNGAHFLAFNHLANVFAPDGAYLGEGYVLKTGNGVVRSYSIQSVGWEFVLPREVREWAFGARYVDQQTQYAASNLQPTASTALVNQQSEQDWASRIGMEGTWVPPSQQTYQENTASNIQPTGFLPASTAPVNQQTGWERSGEVKSETSVTPISTPLRPNVSSQTTTPRSGAFNAYAPNGTPPVVPSSRKRKPRPKEKQ